MEQVYGAIVVGGSIAGLLTAAALLRTAGSVLVLDRDALPAEPGVRRCAAQGAQGHILLDAGREAVESLLPGVFDEILADGGLQIDFGMDLTWFHGDHYKVRCPIRFPSYVQTRPLLEHHIRRRVLALDGITVRAESVVSELIVARGAVRGVVVTTPEEGRRVLEAPIVVDAAGRGSQASRWLEAAGYVAPPISQVKLGLGYASRMYRMPKGGDGARTRAIYGDRSVTKRHGLRFEVEGERWLVTLMGYHGDHPPRDPAGFEAFARSLARPEIGDSLVGAEPLSDVSVFKAPAQIRRHFERVRLPEGFAVVGDAACALDPVFGQGMSVAAVTAAGIAKHLERRPFSARAVARIASRSAATAWLLTSGEAMRYRDIPRFPGIGALHWFLDRVGHASSRDPVMFAAFLEVMHLHRGPLSLLRPDLLLRVFAPRLRAPARAIPQEVAAPAK